jgi:hypothetical protein
MSPRKLAKAVLFHTRRARIRTLAAPREVPWLRRRLRLPTNSPFDPLRDDSPADVTVTPLDAAEAFTRPMPHLTGAPSEAVEFFATRRTERTEPSYVAEFRDGVAWGHPTGGIFTSDGRFVPAFTHDPSGAASHTVWTKLKLPRPRMLAGRTLYLVTPEATDNFHHWLIDLLPRLGLVQRAGYDLKSFDQVIVNHAQRAYQLSTLAHLGITPEKLILATESLWVRCESMVVPSLKNNHQTLPNSDRQFLRQAFLGAASPQSSSSRRIFLSRGDAQFRRLLNETDLRPLLRARGFEIIMPGKLEFTEQVRLFSEASVVAGVAGAAFANLVFTHAPARVIEIAPPQWLAAFHWMISARGGLDHTILLGDGPVMRGVPDSFARQADIVLQPHKLVELLDSQRDPSASSATVPHSTGQ